MDVALSPAAGGLDGGDAGLFAGLRAACAVLDAGALAAGRAVAPEA